MRPRHAQRSEQRPALRPDSRLADAAVPAVVLLLLLLCLLPALPSAAAGAPGEGDATDRETRALPLKIVPAGVEEVHLMPASAAPADTGDGGGDAAYVYRVEYRDGHVEIISPEAFAKLLYTEYYGRNRLFAVLNITSPVGVAWVALGLLGQVLFTGRMLVQWLASERNRRSVVPVAFWWMSLGGATMLIVYFVWRKDIVGVLGQATGWFIYVRNLRLIYSSTAPDPEEESEPGSGPGETAEAT